MRKLKKLPGLSLKVRTADGWIIAAMWMDGAQVDEVARINMNYCDGPGGELYQAWLHAVEALFTAFVASATGIDISVKRQAPNYQGEDHGDDAER